MIQKIQRNANYKVIMDNAFIFISHIRSNSKSQVAKTAYKRYLAEGTLAPGYAKTILKTAKNDVFARDVKKMIDRNMSVDEFQNRCDNLNKSFLELLGENVDAINKFEEAGRKMYPKTWELRQNILLWYQDTTKNRFRTSQFKDLKSNFWATMEKHKNKIGEEFNID